VWVVGLRTTRVAFSAATNRQENPELASSLNPAPKMVTRVPAAAGPSEGVLEAQSPSNEKRRVSPSIVSRLATCIRG